MSKVHSVGLRRILRRESQHQAMLCHRSKSRPMRLLHEYTEELEKEHGILAEKP